MEIIELADHYVVVLRKPEYEVVEPLLEEIRALVA